MKGLPRFLTIFDAIAVEDGDSHHRRAIPRSLVTARQMSDLAVVEHPLKVGDGLGITAELFVELARTIKGVVEEGAVGVRPSRRNLHKGVARRLDLPEVGHSERDLIRDGLAKLG